MGIIKDMTIEVEDINYSIVSINEWMPAVILE